MLNKTGKMAKPSYVVDTESINKILEKVQQFVFLEVQIVPIIMNTK